MWIDPSFFCAHKFTQQYISSRERAEKLISSYISLGRREPEVHNIDDLTVMIRLVEPGKLRVGINIAGIGRVASDFVFHRNSFAANWMFSIAYGSAWRSGNKSQNKGAVE